MYAVYAHGVQIVHLHQGQGSRKVSNCNLVGREARDECAEVVYGAGRVHVFRVCLAVSLGIATVMLMDATNTFYFAWFR